MKNAWEKTWNWLNNKKRNIGLLGMTMIQEIPEIEQSMSHGWFMALKIVIYVFAGGGMLHGDLKNNEKSITKKVIKNIRTSMMKSK